MGSLRTRFTILLVVAVLLVLVIATFVTTQLLRRPSDALFEQALAEKAQLALMLLDEDPTAAERLHIVIGEAPLPAWIDRKRTEGLAAAARQNGYEAEMAMLSRPENEARGLAVRLPDGRWAYLVFPGPGPFPLWPLVAYLTLVAAGVVAVAVYASEVMMRPLRVLDEAIAKIRPDGVIPEMTEEGPMEVRTTVRTINKLASRLNAAMASRMRLVAAAGHDMRTPMTRMRLRAEFVTEQDDRAAWLKDLDELDQIADSAIRLVREEVSPHMHEPVSLDGLVQEVVTEISEMGLPVQKGEITTAIVSGASFALKRALRNLVVNAATHGQGVEVSLSLDGDESAILKIADQGPGIPTDLLDRVFEPFFRVDQARRKLIPGAGLGLAIAREIIENHGGAIEIVNRPGGGLQQTVRLPLLVS
ncbi:signal transduction histidine kinase [Pararhizobium capsulatum DSM 1112]|uniref:histidine kinase n=1 Tax=Pararhizobium capsulatum DSM 1112 TaxID=1121113 RepID=A0ABU0BUK6_9HYPH|nr:ATP-binding protein [Pararhizobium capsulatum]MDQ0321929.1 signal transduction histidine kinase [Pararhizobium capsulatum DSM 1112]